ncbi:MAG: murein biosynthesis integral membrane protein MurJ [Acidobacteriota bacterium]
MKNLKVVLTGGGTGGHVYPNIAIYEALLKESPGSEFLYIGTRRGAERVIVKNIPRPIKFKSVPSRGLPGKLKSFNTLISLVHIFTGMVKSVFLLKKFKPDIVIGSGGYVSAPVLFAASLLRLKIFVHEQNSVPGRMNRFIAKKASKIAVSFKSTLNYLPEKKCIYSGYPLREMIKPGDRETLCRKLGIPPKNKVVFIFGGSKGARTINNAVVDILPELLKLKNLTIILSTGRSRSQDYMAYEETIKKTYNSGINLEDHENLIIKEYFDNIDEIYGVSDLIISRAGAGTIEEISRLAIPSILIPKIDLPGDHQIMNAKEAEKRGGARVIYEQIAFKNGESKIKVAEEELLSTFTELITDDNILLSMKKELSDQVKKDDPVNIIIKTIKKLTGGTDEKEEEEIVSFYLHSEDDEKNYELIFSNTTFGNTFLSSHYIDLHGKNFLFEIKITGDESSLVLRKIKGDVSVNGNPVKKIQEIIENDRIEINGKTFILRKYSESVEKYIDNKRTESKILGSSFGILLSRVGGFFREIVITGLFGAKNITDLYVAGLTISNLMRRIVAENALENVFLPIFMRLFRRSPRKKMWESASSIMNFTLVFAVLITITGIIFTPELIRLIYPGFEAKGITADAILVTRMMFPYLILVTIAAIFATLLKAFNRFGIAEFSAVFFSVGSITGILALYSVSHVHALGIGILFGGFLHAAFLFPFVRNLLKGRSIQFTYSPSIKFTSQVNKKYYSQLIPISLDVFLSKTAEVVDQFLASGLKAGSISFLYFAKAIFRLPFAIISQAINSVILRDFSDKIALFNKEKARKLFIDGVNINIFLLAPVSIILLMLADPIVSIIYGRGQFVTENVRNTSFALQFYSIGLTGWGLHSLTSRIFSARIDIKTSMFLNLVMLMSNIGFSLYFVNTDLKFAGLALATTLSFTLFSIIRIFVLIMKLSKEGITIKLSELLTPFLKTVTASIFMIIVMIQSRTIFTLISPGSEKVKDLILILSLSFIGISIYLISSLLLKNSGIFIFKRRRSGRSESYPLSMAPPESFLERIKSDPLKFRNDYLYKINIYLNSSRWEIRNVGIKLIGLFRDETKVSYLAERVKSRSDNGFLRRNSINSLRKIMVWSKETREALLQGINDPYYEVRVASINAITEHIVEKEYERFSKISRKRFDKSTTEEKLALIRLLSIAGTKDDLDFLDRYFLSENSLIREELLRLILKFYRKDILSKVDVIKYINKILLTSNNMKPHFELRSILNEIHTEINKI